VGNRFAQLVKDCESCTIEEVFWFAQYQIRVSDLQAIIKLFSRLIGLLAHIGEYLANPLRLIVQAL
jgi:hypothetical protein